MNNDDELRSSLASLVDNDLRLDVDVDQVIQAGVRRRRNRRVVTGAALGTAGLVAGLLTITSQLGAGVDTAAQIVNGPNETWLSGENAEGDSVLQRWDGRRWTDVPLPLLPETWTTSDITSDGREGLLMAGKIGGTDEKPVVWHWDGASWADFPTPDGTVHISAVGMIPGTGTLWMTAKKEEERALPPSDAPGAVTLGPGPSLVVAFRQIR